MAKRVNTKFLIILTSIFGLILAAGLTVHFVGVFRKDPKAQERAGDDLLIAGNPKAALDKYKYAIARDPNNKQLLVKVGDASNQTAADATPSPRAPEPVDRPRRRKPDRRRRPAIRAGPSAPARLVLAADGVVVARRRHVQ